MATIYRTPASTWKAIVRKKGWPRSIKTFRTKRDAQDWARRTEDEMVRGVYIDRAQFEQLLLKDAITRYVNEVTAAKRPTTQAGEKIRADMLTDELGDYSIAAITPWMIAAYRDKRLNAGKSPNTVRLELALLSHMYTVALQEWQIGLIFNPVAQIRKPAPGHGRKRRLTKKEEKKLLKACAKQSNPMLGWMVRVALHTGMRAGEIGSITRSQVDTRGRVVVLTETKNGSARTVPLTKAAVKAFKEALKHGVRPEDTDLIFWGEPGRDKIRRSYSYAPAWKKTLSEAKVEGLRFHDLRHEAISRLVEAGLSDQEVAAISGHKSMQMLRRYTHLRAADLVARLDQAGVR